jgi:hypothetical protein
MKALRAYCSQYVGLALRDPGATKMRLKEHSHVLL